MLKQNTNRNQKLQTLHIIVLLLICMSIFIGIFSAGQTASAATARGDLVDTVYVNNVPFPKDWKMNIYRTNVTNVKMKDNVSGWFKKDSDHDITIQCSKSVSGTISYGITSSGSVGAKTLDGALSASTSVSQTLNYAYTETNTKAFTWKVSPSDSGNYFCIAVNYQTREYDIDCYLQKFKLFGQGPYNYYGTATVEIPSVSYLAKNYRYEIDGAIYEK